jgi:transcriptional regulator with XRE-family HTH domain
MELGHLVKKHRSRQGLSELELAGRAGIPAVAVSACEEGLPIFYGYLFKMAQALHVPMSEFDERITRLSATQEELKIAA